MLRTIDFIFLIIYSIIIVIIVYQIITADVSKDVEKFVEFIYFHAFAFYVKSIIEIGFHPIEFYESLVKFIDEIECKNLDKFMQDVSEWFALFK